MTVHCDDFIWTAGTGGNTVGQFEKRLDHRQHFMKFTLLLLLAGIMAGQSLPAQTSDDAQNFSGKNKKEISYAPLSLTINGAGQIFPFEDGQMLQVGRNYLLVAVPDRGYVFSGWSRVNVFNFSEITVNAAGQPNSPIYSTILSPVPTNIRNPVLEFRMEPIDVLYDFPGVRTLTHSVSWQADFVPRKKRVSETSGD